MQDPPMTDNGPRLLMAALARKALAAGEAMAEHARSVLEALDDNRDASADPCPWCADWHNIGPCLRLRTWLDRALDEGLLATALKGWEVVPYKPSPGDDYEAHRQGAAKVIAAAYRLAAYRASQERV